METEIEAISHMVIETDTIPGKDILPPSRAVAGLVKEMSTEEGQTYVAIEQEISVQYGRLDRAGITRAIRHDAEGTRFDPIITMKTGGLMAGSLCAMLLQSTPAFNLPLHHMSAALAAAERKGRDQRFEGRALYLPRGIFLISDDDFLTENELNAEHLPDSPYLIGAMILAEAQSNHEKLENAAAVQSAIDITSALLNHTRAGAPRAQISARAAKLF